MGRKPNLYNKYIKPIEECANGDCLKGCVDENGDLEGINEVKHIMEEVIFEPAAAMYEAAFGGEENKERRRIFSKDTDVDPTITTALGVDFSPAFRLPRTKHGFFEANVGFTFALGFPLEPDCYKLGENPCATGEKGEYDKICRWDSVAKRCYHDHEKYNRKRIFGYFCGPEVDVGVGAQCTSDLTAFGVDVSLEFTGWETP